ncbi:MAG: hypothetical protein K2H35_00125 [Muribaculaceae bacterium]|nr:hypothetical protein [Muribaculaceae bacterium]
MLAMLRNARNAPGMLAMLRNARNAPECSQASLTKDTSAPEPPGNAPGCRSRRGEAVAALA